MLHRTTPLKIPPTIMRRCARCGDETLHFVGEASIGEHFKPHFRAKICSICERKTGTQITAGDI